MMEERQKDNVIVILLDSVYSQCLGTGRTERSSTPFIDRLITEGLYTPNMYSMGPYTDAATKALFCSEPTMNGFGYYFGINASKNHFEVFHDNGYEIFGFYYPYYHVGRKTSKIIDHSVYTGGYIYSSTWRGKLEYYKNLRAERSLTAQEEMLICKVVDLMFGCWIQFYTDLLTKEEASWMLKDYYEGKDVELALEKLKQEIAAYQENPISYINRLLDDGMGHTLATIDPIRFDSFADKDFLKSIVYPKNKKTIQYLQKRTKKLNRKNNSLPIRQKVACLFRTLKTRNKNELRLLYNEYCLLNAPKKMVKDTFKELWQVTLSAKNQLTKGLQFLSEKKSDTPFYAFFHVEDAHERVSFFSYDRHDANEISQEFAMAQEVAENCGDNFKGSLIYQASLRYLDHCIEQLFEWLKEQGLYENTTVMLMSDHGSSYTHNPIRNVVVNNFYNENYQVPMLIWNTKLKKEEKHVYTAKYSSIDVFPTLLAVVGCEQPKEFQGKDIRTFVNGREYVTVEYGGPGVPDMLTKSIWMSARSNEYSISYKILPSGSFDRGAPCELYDLQADPLEQVNLAGTGFVYNKGILLLLDVLEKRYKEMLQNRDEFLNQLESVSFD